MSRKYTIDMNLSQMTDGSADNITSTTEESDDLAIHLVKVKVFTKHMTGALDAITQELCDMGLAVVGKPGKARK